MPLRHVPICYHYPVIFHLETNQSTHRREQDQTRSLYNYHKTDQIQLFHELQVLNYVVITNTPDLWSHLKATLINARNVSTPTCRVSYEQSPRWHTSEIRHILKQIKTLKKSLKSQQLSIKKHNCHSLNVHFKESVLTQKQNTSTLSLHLFRLNQKPCLGI